MLRAVYSFCCLQYQMWWNTPDKSIQTCITNTLVTKYWRGKRIEWDSFIGNEIVATLRRCSNSSTWMLQRMPPNILKSSIRSAYLLLKDVKIPLRFYKRCFLHIKSTRSCLFMRSCSYLHLPVAFLRKNLWSENASRFGIDLYLLQDYITLSKLSKSCNVAA